MKSIGIVVSKEMFENVDKQQRMEAGVICILFAQLGAFSFGELKTLFHLTMYGM